MPMVEDLGQKEGNRRIYQSHYLTCETKAQTHCGEKCAIHHPPSHIT